MTTLRSSQLGSIGVRSGVSNLRASQFATTAIAANIAAAGLRASQLIVVAVTTNNKPYKALGPVIGLNCWTPCGVLAWNGE